MSDFLQDPLAAYSQRLKQKTAGSERTFTVYHGTDNKLDGFDDQYKGDKHGKSPVNMAGFHFTDSEQVARTFGNNVVKAKVTINKPFVFDAKGKSYSELKHIVNDQVPKARKRGCDGLIIKNYGDVGLKPDNDLLISNHYIPFSTSQIQVIKDSITASYSKKSDWMKAEDLRPGDTVVDSGVYFVTNVRREGDEIAVQGKNGVFRRYSPEDEVSIWRKRAAEDIPSKLYHGTSMFGVVGILKDNIMYEGVYWNKPDEPHGIRFTKSKDVAYDNFAHEGLGGEEGAVIEFDSSKLSSKYEIVEYTDTQYNGDKWRVDEQEVVVLAEEIPNIKKYITAIYLKNPFKTKAEIEDYALLCEQEERISASEFVKRYEALLTNPIVKKADAPRRNTDSKVVEWLTALRNRPDADELYIHGSRNSFEAFKEPNPNRGELIFFSKLTEIRQASDVLQAEYYGDNLYACKLDKGTPFNPLSDPRAKEILEKALGGQYKYVPGESCSTGVWDYEGKIKSGRLDYQDLHRVLPMAEAAGYDRFTVYECSIQGNSYGVAHANMVKVVDTLPMMARTASSSPSELQYSVNRRSYGFDVVAVDSKNETLGLLQIDYSGNGRAIVKAVDVHEDYQRQGIALKLYQIAKKELKARGIHTLSGALEGSGPVQIREKVFGAGNTRFLLGGKEIPLDEAIKIMDVDYGRLRAESKIVAKQQAKSTPVTPKSMKWIENELKQLREEEGGGQCYTMAEILQNKFGWEKVDGFYLRPGLGHDKVGHGDHAWNVMKDKTIVDATHDQFGKPDIAIIKPNDPEYKNYHAYCGNYDCPYCTCDFCNPDFAEEARKVRNNKQAKKTPIHYAKEHTHEEYQSFMENLKKEMRETEGSLEGMCYDACFDMKQKFPELHWYEGWVRGEKSSGSHSWMVAPDGTVYDPTIEQFDNNPIIDREVRKIDGKKVRRAKKEPVHYAFYIEVPKAARSHFWDEPPEGSHEFWAFRTRPRVLKGERIIFTIDKKPVAETVCSFVEKPGQSKCQNTGKYEKHWKVYWEPKDFKKYKSASGPVHVDADGNYGEYHLSVEAKPFWVITATYKDKVVGEAEFEDDGDKLVARHVGVDPAHRRKGLATAMYQFAERELGRKIEPSYDLTEDGQSLWNQSNRPFGRRAAAELPMEQLEDGVDMSAPLHISQFPLNRISMGKLQYERTIEDIQDGRTSRNAGPVMLFYDTYHKQFVVYDGMHRIVEALLAGKKFLPAEVWSGSYSDLASVPKGEDYREKTASAIKVRGKNFLLYHGTSEIAWKEDAEEDRELYLTIDLEDAKNYAYERAAGDEYDGLPVTPIVLSIQFSELSSYTLEPDRGADDRLQDGVKTYQESLEATGSMRIRGDIKALKPKFKIALSVKDLVDSAHYDEQGNPKTAYLYKDYENKETKDLFKIIVNDQNLKVETDATGVRSAVLNKPVTLHHATRDKYLNNIMKNGLEPQGTKNKLFLGTEDTCHMYVGEGAVVLAVTVPAGTRIYDNNFEPDEVYIKDKITPSLIKRAANRSLYNDIRDALRLVGKDIIHEIQASYDDWSQSPSHQFYEPGGMCASFADYLYEGLSEALKNVSIEEVDVRYGEIPHTYVVVRRGSERCSVDIPYTTYETWVGLSKDGKSRFKKKPNVIFKLEDIVVKNLTSKKGNVEPDEYLGNCTEDAVVEAIFGDATLFAQALENSQPIDENTCKSDEYGVIIKYNPDEDIHYFYKSASAPSEAWVGINRKTAAVDLRALRVKWLEQAKAVEATHPQPLPDGRPWIPWELTRDKAYPEGTARINRSGGMETVTRMPVDKLEWIQDTVNTSDVETYRNNRVWEKSYPIVREFTNPTRYEIVDGHHRIEAAKEAGEKSILVWLDTRERSNVYAEALKKLGYDPNKIAAESADYSNNGDYDKNNNSITASTIISGEEVLQYMMKLNHWSKDVALQVLGVDGYGSDYTLRDFPLSRLKAGDDYNPALSKQYADRPTPFPPVVLGYDWNWSTRKKKLVIKDGNHRVDAAKQRGDKTIKAYVPIDDSKTASVSSQDLEELFRETGYKLEPFQVGGNVVDAWQLLAPEGWLYAFGKTKEEALQQAYDRLSREMNTSKHASLVPPTVMYHMSRRRNRNSILKNGLVPQIKEYKEIDRKPGIFLFGTLSDAQDWAYWFRFTYGGKVDVWKVVIPDSVQATRDTHAEMDDYDAWIVYSIIPPENLTLVDTVDSSTPEKLKSSSWLPLDETKVVNIPLSSLIPDEVGRDPQAISSLVEKINKSGRIDPIEVNEMGDGKFFIEDGTHRYYAAQKLGINELPAYIRRVKKGSFKNALLNVSITPDGKFKEFSLSLKEGTSWIGTPMLTVRARNSEGEIIAYVTFAKRGNNILDPMSLDVTEAYRRQGVATAMYVFAERKTGRKIIPSTEQTPEGKQLWNQPNRPFGKSGAREYPAELDGLAAEARKCSTFEQFKHDFLSDIKHGQYWHITHNPNFTIDPKLGPHDRSSMADGEEATGALMVTSHFEYWDGFYNFNDDDERVSNRNYAALIDLSQVPREDYGQVNRGMGNEFYIENAAAVGAKVVKVMPIEEAASMSRQYEDLIYKYIDNERQLKAFWLWATGKKTAARRPKYRTYVPDTRVFSDKFMKWFEGSKVVDEYGRPLMVWHGSPDMRGLMETGIFQTLSERYIHHLTPEGKEKAVKERAYFFAGDHATAASYADPHRAFDYQGSEPATKGFYLCLKNPMIVNNQSRKWHGTDNTVEQAKKAGHDGVIIYNTIDNYSVDGHKVTDVYVAFHPNQIKAAEGNSGDYDPNHPSVFASKKANDAALPTLQELRDTIGDAEFKKMWDEYVGNGYVELEEDEDEDARMWEEFQRNFDEAENELWDLPFPLTVYRTVYLPENATIENFRTEGAGTSWRTKEYDDDNSYMQPLDAPHTVKWEMRGRIDSTNEVDWVSTMMARSNPDFGTRENEVTLKKGGVIHLLGYRRKGEAKWTPVNKIITATKMEEVKQAQAKKAASPVIYYHGSSLKNLRSILSQGLLPTVREKNWNEDLNSGVYSPSRESYGGIYLTSNLLTAMGAPRDRHQQEGVVIVVVEVQPNTFYMDEDDVTGCLSSPLGHISGNVWHVGCILLSHLYPEAKSGWSETEHKSQYISKCIDRFKHTLNQRGITLHPELQKRLEKLVGDTWLPALKRVAAHLFKQEGQYEFNRCWYSVWGDSNNTPPAYETVIPTIPSAEKEFRDHVEQITKTMRLGARPEVNGFNSTARVTTPIGYRGANHIISVIEITDKVGAEKPPYITVTVRYGNPPQDFYDQLKERIGSFEMGKKEVTAALTYEGAKKHPHFVIIEQLLDKMFPTLQGEKRKQKAVELMEQYISSNRPYKNNEEVTGKTARARYASSEADLSDRKKIASRWSQWIPREVMEKYSYGYCTRLAIALSKRFGWPIEIGWEDGDKKHISHAWVLTPDGRGLDICGFNGHTDFEPFSSVSQIGWPELEELVGAKPSEIAEADTVIDKYIIPAFLNTQEKTADYRTSVNRTSSGVNTLDLSSLQALHDLGSNGSKFSYRVAGQKEIDQIKRDGYLAPHFQQGEHKYIYLSSWPESVYAYRGNNYIVRVDIPSGHGYTAYEQNIPADKIAISRPLSDSEAVLLCDAIADNRLVHLYSPYVLKQNYGNSKSDMQKWEELNGRPKQSATEYVKSITPNWVKSGNRWIEKDNEPTLKEAALQTSSYYEIEPGTAKTLLEFKEIFRQRMEEEKQQYGEVDQQALEEWEILNQLPITEDGGLTLWRAISLPKDATNEDINTNHVGIYWAWDKSNAFPYGAEEGIYEGYGRIFTLQAKLGPDNVVWERIWDSILFFHQSMETEVRLEPGDKLLVTEVHVSENWSHLKTPVSPTETSFLNSLVGKTITASSDSEYDKEIDQLEYEYDLDDATSNTSLGRVVWGHSPVIKTNKARVLGITDAEKYPAIRGLHVGDVDFWFHKLVDDYDRDSAAWEIEIYPVEGDYLIEDRSYAIPELSGNKAESYILITSRTELHEGKDFRYVRELGIDKNAALDKTAIVSLEYDEAVDKTYIYKQLNNMWLARLARQRKPTVLGMMGSYQILTMDLDDDPIIAVYDSVNNLNAGYASFIRHQNSFEVDRMAFTIDYQGFGIAAKLYRWLIIKGVVPVLVSGFYQSMGGRSTWEKLAKEPGIFVYGWNNRTRQAFSIDPNDLGAEEVIWSEDASISDETGEKLIIPKTEEFYDNVLVAIKDR